MFLRCMMALMVYIAVVVIMITDCASAFSINGHNGGAGKALVSSFQTQNLAHIGARSVTASPPFHHNANTKLHSSNNGDDDKKEEGMKQQEKNVLWQTWDKVFSSPIVPPLLFFGPIIGTLYKNLGLDSSFLTQNPIATSSVLIAVLTAFAVRFQMAQIDDIVFEKRLALQSLKNARARQFADADDVTDDMNAAKARYEGALRKEMDARNSLFVFASLAERRQQDVDADEYAVKTFLNMELKEDGQLVPLDK